MADTNHAIQLYKTSATAKKVGINVTNNSDMSNCTLFVNGTIKTSNSGGTWILQREKAALKSYSNPGNTTSAYSIASIKSATGNWAIATLGNSDNLIFNYTSDTNYSAGTNNSISITLGNGASGTIYHTGNKPALTDLSGTLAVDHGGTGATTAAAALTNLGAAAASHTHNYAGSSSAGGAATSSINFRAYEGTSSSNRLTTADQDPGNGYCIWFHATSSMTTNKPYSDGHILHFAWDNASPSWASQLFISDGKDNLGVGVRGRNASAWGAWQPLVVCSKINNTSYWGISINGSESGYIRMPTDGIIPYTSGGAG